MSQLILLELADDGSVNHRPYDPNSTPPEQESTPTTTGDSDDILLARMRSRGLKMAVVNDSNMSRNEVLKWISVHQEIIDKFFCIDWIHVELRLADSIDDVDFTIETPHFLTNGIDVAGAAGYHSITVRAGGDIDGYAVTDVDSNNADETFGHEVFEWAANFITAALMQYWGDANRQIMGEVCDPTTGTPHLYKGVNVASWVTKHYLQGDNKERENIYDSGYWFNELPRVSGPKKRTPRGFQIFFNIATRQIEYEFGMIDPSVPWQMQGEVKPATSAPYDPRMREHVQRRCARFYRNQQILGVV